MALACQISSIGMKYIASDILPCRTRNHSSELVTVSSSRRTVVSEECLKCHSSNRFKWEWLFKTSSWHWSRRCVELGDCRCHLLWCDRSQWFLSEGRHHLRYWLSLCLGSRQYQTNMWIIIEPLLSTGEAYLWHNGAWRRYSTCVGVLPQLNYK